MTTWAIIPVKPLNEGKSRLRESFKQEDLINFNQDLFNSTFTKLKQAESIDQILVISRDRQVLEWSSLRNCICIEEEAESSLNLAVSRSLEFIGQNNTGHVLIIPVDLPLMTPLDLENFMNLSKNGSKFAGIIPDTHQLGTNAIFVSSPEEFVPKFGSNSFQKHCKYFLNKRTPLVVYLNKRIQQDLDTQQDLERIQREKK